MSLPADPPAAPVRRKLAWEYQLDQRHGVVETASNFVPDVWRRGGLWRIAALVVAPLWLVVMVTAAAVAFAAVVFVAALAAAAVAGAFFLVYAAIGLAVGLLG